MADKLIFEVQATSKGLKVVQKDTDKLAQSVERTNVAREKAGKGQNSYNKREKAIHQANLSSAKGFSKMNQTMGGSSGLVGAYATLAANVFAATAAFNALRRAAQLEQLIEGLEMVGAAAGRNLTFASQKLREVSGFAISADQSMRNMALGISAGFSTEQMEGLTKVARGASIALGRDMADAIDRLTRGAAKLEPEILDELGIMVRLDQATEDYATTLGKNVTQLSQFERRQAFLNAILEQGEIKFGALADSIEPSSYDKLAATLGDLVISISNLTNKALGPMVEMLSKNTPALIGILVLFGSTITKQLLPGLSNMAKGSADAAAGAATQAKAQLNQLKVTAKMPDAYTAASAAMQKGGMSQKQYDRGVRSLTASTRAHQQQLDADPQKYAKGTIALKTKQLAMDDNRRAMQQLNVAYTMHGAAQAKNTLSNAIELVQQKELGAGYRMLGAAISQYSATTMGAVANSNLLHVAFARLKIGMFALSATAKTTGAALMSALGWISLVVTAAMLLYQAFKDDIWPPDPIADEAESIIEALESIQDTAKSFQTTMDTVADPAHVAVAGYKALSGVLTELKGHMAGFSRLTEEGEGESSAKFATALAEQQAALDTAKAEMKGVPWYLQMADYQEAKRQAQAAAVEIDRLVTEMAADSNKKAEAQTEGLINMVDAAVTGLSSQPGMKEFAALQIAALEELKVKISRGLVDPEKIKAEMDKIGNPVGAITAAFDGARDAAALFAKETNKLAQKDKTPFDKSIDAAIGMQNQLRALEDGYKGMAKGVPLPKAMQDQQTALEKSLREQMGIDVSIGNTKELDDYIEKLQKNRITIIQSAEAVKKLQATHKALKNIVKGAGTVEALKAQLDVEEDIRQTKLDAVTAEIENTIMLRGNATQKKIDAAREAKDETLLATLLKEQADIKEDITDLETRQTALQQAKLDDGVRAAQLNIAELEHSKKLLGFVKQITASRKADLANREKEYKLQQELLIAQDPKRLRTTGIATTEGENLQAFYKFQDEKRRLILEEFELKEKSIAADNALLKAKHALLEAEILAMMATGEMDAVAGATILTSIAELPNIMDQAAAAAQKAAASQKQAALTGLEVEEKKAGLAARSALIAGAGGTGNLAGNIKQLQMHAVAFRDAAVEKFRQQAIKDFDNVGNLKGDKLIKAARAHAEKLIEEEGERKIGDAAIAAMPLQEKIEMISNMTGPLIEQLKQLGPEGELVSVIAQGAFAMTEQWASVSDVFSRTAEDVGGKANAMEKAIAVAQAVASTVAQTAAIMAAASSARIAAIDQEIAAEKKRDGKSKDSLSKIKGLEKKREQMARKAFEQNKKMQMASIIANTAAGVMGVIGHESGKVGIFSIVLAAIVAAMGAAQLAIVAGTSFQGGGGGISASGPKSVSTGERGNRVDLGKGGNASGELAYLRGEKGVGTGSSDYRPGAFAGKRYRAAGGTAYVVGEQGPELFMPEVPGQVVTNDNAASMGAPVNVSFQVSAIDSSNMQDMLTTQRGSIISMIREAANSHGSGFLENVDVSTYDEGGSI